LRYKYKKLDYHTEELGLLNNSELKKIADYWLRQYLLGKQKNGIYYYCPLKKRNYPLTQMHVAHFIDRGILNTRFDLINCHLISAISNTFDAQVQVEGHKSKHHKEYEEYLIKEYGKDSVDDLKIRGKVLKILCKQDYIDIIDKFRSDE
jgi:hypothetical protein